MSAEDKVARNWRDMSTEERLLAISERADRTFKEIGHEFGVAAKTLSKFINKQGTSYHQLKADYKRRVWAAIADRAAPLWKEGMLTLDIAESLGITSSKLERVIAYARQNGDKRFPRRVTTAPRKPRPVKPSSTDESLRPIGEAFLRERHPDGEQYTLACVVKAHREFPKGFKFRKAGSGLSQRELTNLMQSARVRA